MIRFVCIHLNLSLLERFLGHKVWHSSSVSIFAASLVSRPYPVPYFYFRKRKWNFAPPGSTILLQKKRKSVNSVFVQISQRDDNMDFSFPQQIYNKVKCKQMDSHQAVYDLTFSFVLFTGAVYQMCKLLNLLFDFPANMLRCIQRASLKYTNAKCKQMNSHQAVFDCSNLLNVLRCNVRAQVFPKIYKMSPCLIFPIFCKISRIWFSQFVFPSLDVFVLWFNTCILKWHLDKIQFFFRFPSLDVFVLVCLISISWCVCVVHPQVGSFVRCRGRLLING